MIPDHDSKGADISLLQSNWQTDKQLLYYRLNPSRVFRIPGHLDIEFLG